MSKKYITVRNDNNALHTSYEEAERKAKKATLDSGEDWLILETIAKAVAPLPQVDIVKL